ncbi:MAG: hypothetical protein ABW133_16055 [Polyangiaceae bacterium]
METHSSLVLRYNDTKRRFVARAALRNFAALVLVVCASCGDDSGSIVNPDGNGSPDAATDTSSGRDVVADGGPGEDGNRPDGAGGGSDAPATNDAARDTASADRDAMGGTDTSPPSDARNDAALDTSADTGGTDVVRNDATSDTAVADVTSEPPVPPNDAPSTCGLCTGYGPAEQAGKITTSSLNALSGLSASLRNAGVVYVHNDRNVAQFSAVSEAGALLGTFNVTGAAVDDIEDMAVAHCPSGTCVYLADVGGNITPRTQFGVVRVPEPQVDVNTPGGTTSIAGEKLLFSYPDGANHNAESILVDPQSETIYVITKVAAGMPSAVYKFPATFGAGALTATKVIDLTVPKSTDKEATSASAHPCAPAFLLRTYNTLYEFRAAPGAMLEAAFAATPTVVPVATESQGEGVAYRADGKGYFTTTEGSQPPLNRVGCQ